MNSIPQILIKVILGLAICFAVPVAQAQVKSCRVLPINEPFKWGLTKPEVLELIKIDPDQVVSEMFDNKRVSIAKLGYEKKTTTLLGFYTRSGQLNEISYTYKVPFNQGKGLLEFLFAKYAQFGEPLHTDTFEGFSFPAQGYTMRRHTFEMPNSTYLLIDEDTVAPKEVNSTIVVRLGCGFKEYLVSPVFPEIDH